MDLLRWEKDRTVKFLVKYEHKIASGEDGFLDLAPLFEKAMGRKAKVKV